MNKRQMYTATACFASFCGALYGQTGEKTASFQYFVTNDMPGAVSVRVDGMSGKIVKDKPFSAMEERETLQILGDGTHIDKKETDKYFRDAQGRTRIERNNGASISITDPVAGFATEMSTGSKTAHKMVQMRTTAGGGTFSAGAMPQVVIMDKLKAEAQAIDRLKTEAQSTDKFKAEMAASGRATLSTTTSENMIFTRTAGIAVEGEKPVTEDLGTQLINGISAQGTRTTITIPAGQIGNDREIKVVSERWFSPDLQMLIKSSNKDPRFGETTYQLTNVLQGAQDPTLFQIPSDFTVNGLK